MLATAIIVFREVLEAALIVGIVMAASQGVPRRGGWVAGGVVGGALGAIVVAGFAETLAAAAAGIGQEIFNAAILFAAVAMLGWHNIWMRRHAGDVGPVEQDSPFGGREEAADEVEEGCLPGAVRTDHRTQLAGVCAFAGNKAQLVENLDEESSIVMLAIDN